MLFFSVIFFSHWEWLNSPICAKWNESRKCVPANDFWDLWPINTHDFCCYCCCCCCGFFLIALPWFSYGQRVCVTLFHVHCVRILYYLISLNCISPAHNEMKKRRRRKKKKKKMMEKKEKRKWKLNSNDLAVLYSAWRCTGTPAHQHIGRDNLTAAELQKTICRKWTTFGISSRFNPKMFHCDHFNRTLTRLCFASNVPESVEKNWRRKRRRNWRRRRRKTKVKLFSFSLFQLFSHSWICFMNEFIIIF